MSLVVTQKLFADWRADLTGNFSDIRQTLNTLVDDGVPEDLTLIGRATTSRESSIDLSANGSIKELPGGSVKGAFGFTFRKQDFESPRSTTDAPNASRHITSGYAELMIPVFGPANSISGVRSLELSIAGRYDDYSDFGSTVNPKAGLSWEPVTGLRLKGTFGTSFTAPLLDQVHTPVGSNAFPIADSSAASGLTNALQLFGGNEGLKAQRSTSITVGSEVRPENIPGSLVDFGYFDIKFRHRIAQPPTFGLTDLSNPLLSPYVQRNPPLALVQSYFDNPYFQGDELGLGPQAVEAIFDNRLANIAETRQSGLQLNVNYSRPVKIGDVHFSLGGEHLIRNEIQTVAGAPFASLLDSFSEPTKWKARGSAGWGTGGFTSLATLNYTGAYKNDLQTPPDPISSWVTVDVYASYNTSGSLSGTSAHGFTFSFSVQNLTNKQPPRIAIPSAYLLPGQAYLPFDASNSSPVGRLLSISVMKDW